MPFEIPDVDTPMERDVVEAEHPDYEARKKQYDFYASAYAGGGGFAPDLSAWTTSDVPTNKVDFDAYFNGSPSFDPTYLEPNLREGRQFERRVKRSWYDNRIKPGLRKIAGFLLKIPPERTGLPPLTAAWLQSVSPSGISWNRWLETELIPWFLTYGSPTALLDRPSSGALTRWQQDPDAADRLTIGLIHPSMILAWELDQTGRYTWLKYLEIMDAPADPLATTFGRLYRYRWITQDGWFYVDDIKDSNGSSETNALKVNDAGLWRESVTGAAQAELLQGAPLATWRLGETGESYIKDAAVAARAQYNHASRRDNLLKETSFPMLTSPTVMNAQSDDGPVVVGPNGFMEFSDEAKHRPEWMSPDPGPFDTFQQVDERLSDTIDAMLGFTIGQAGTTGVAKSFDMAELTRLLKNLSSDCQEGEIAALRVAAAMHNEEWPEDATSEWNTEFDAVDLDKLVDSLTSLLRMSLGSTADLRLMNRVTRAALPGISEADWGKIKEEQAELVQAGANQDDNPQPAPDEAEPFGGEEEETTAPIERPDAESR